MSLPTEERGSSPVDVFCWKIHVNYKVKHNHCDDFNRCLDGALISSEVNTLNSSDSDPCKNVDRGTTFVFYWSS